MQFPRIQLNHRIHIKQYPEVADAICLVINDLTIGWQNLNLPSHPNTLAPQVLRASGENLKYVTLAPQARQARPSGEILNYSLSC